MLLRGVIAAIATPVDAAFEPDAALFMRLAKHLLHSGCNGLTVFGTTGEATSFSVAQRTRLMRACAASLDGERLMVGTGTASLAETIALTQLAAELGFAGALLLPPFFYKGVSEDGVLAYFAAVVAATQRRPIPLYLYHFPALSGVPFSPALIGRLRHALGGRLGGLKDSSGDRAFARDIAGAHPGLAVFPSDEACLLQAQQGAFAGCISATCNLNAPDCARAFAQADAAALARAMAVRALFSGKPLVAGVKGGLAHQHHDPQLARVVPPLTPWTLSDQAWLGRELDALATGQAQRSL
jgi:4-hydroxy-tetrahydrodipicolinate synthase